MDRDRQDPSAPFVRLGELARSVASGEVSNAVDALGERRVAEAFDAARKRPARGRLVGLATAFAMMAAAVVVSSLRLSRTAVSWTVDGSSSHDTSYISPQHEKEAVVLFSEGSEFDVQPGSRLRIAEAGRKTVKAVLEAGASRVRISGQSSIGWKIDVGPFSVSPTRVASLMVEWLADELMRVSVFEGATSVEGTPSPLMLHAGQRVSANARDGTVEVGPLTIALDVSPRTSAELANGPPDRPLPSDPATTVAPALPAPSSAKRAGWPDAVARGDYASVLLEAERRGIGSVLAEGSLADLVALADAARLSGRVDLAKRGLLAQRSRFSQTSAAKDAAFLLGRMADDHEHAPSTATPWYDTYLSEAPSGHFAAEAFGRKMVAVSRQSGPAAAKDIAGEYLRRFPAGPHAGLARELLSE